MAFFQDPPRLPNQYDDDALLREYVQRRLPPDLMKSLEPTFRELGELGGGALWEAQQADRRNEPVHTPYDAWGNRVDAIELTAVWKEARRLTAQHGLVAVAYERKNHEHSRVHQFVLNYLVQGSLDVYACPLAMTDGAARTLLDLENHKLVERALPRLTSRDAKAMWTSGQWMTERTGGSDVGLSETVARRDEDGRYRLYGSKFFTSAATSEMALTLGRPDGNGPGGKGLALFYVEVRQPDGSYNNIRVNRLKDKLGTRKLPTAELDLEGALATPVAELANGVRNITSMLNVTRTWNAIAAVWGARRAVALARDYAGRRSQFGGRLIELPLHVDTMAGVEAEFEGMFHLAFRAIELLGRREAGVATEAELALLRVLTPLAKLTTGKQVLDVVSEAIECFGGQGYMEDTGIAGVLRDAHVLPLWEGTTNVLSLDTLRAFAKGGTAEGLGAEVARLARNATFVELRPLVAEMEKAAAHAIAWLREAAGDRARAEAGARRLALTLGRTLELGLLIDHAAWCMQHGKPPRALAAARRFARHGVDLVGDLDASDARALAEARPAADA